MIGLSSAEARAIAVGVQGVHDQGGATFADEVLRRIGCVQLDTINVVRRSHKLVLLARNVGMEDAAGIPATLHTEVIRVLGTRNGAAGAGCISYGSCSS